MLGKITLIVVVIYIILWGMGSYAYLDAPRQAFTILLAFLGLVWLVKLLIRLKHRPKSISLPSLTFKGI
jgi:hypothetical protein